MSVKHNMFACWTCSRHPWSSCALGMHCKHPLSLKRNKCILECLLMCLININSRLHICIAWFPCCYLAFFLEISVLHAVFNQAFCRTNLYDKLVLAKLLTCQILLATVLSSFFPWDPGFYHWSHKNACRSFPVFISTMLKAWMFKAWRSQGGFSGGGVASEKLSWVSL